MDKTNKPILPLCTAYPLVIDHSIVMGTPPLFQSNLHPENCFSRFFRPLGRKEAAAATAEGEISIALDSKQVGVPLHKT